MKAGLILFFSVHFVVEKSENCAWNFELIKSDFCLSLSRVTIERLVNNSWLMCLVSKVDSEA
jgi:hypothetical protein